MFKVEFSIEFSNSARMGFLENLELRILDLGNSLTWVPTILVRFGSFWFAEAALLVRFGSLLVRCRSAQVSLLIRILLLTLT